MTVETSSRSGKFALGALVALSGMALSGCVGMGPTYGTGKASDVQLLEDVSSMFSIAPKRGPQIDYKPRPELVKPGSKDVLPAPQDNIVTTAAGTWPESPEMRRARIRADATANRDTPGFEPEVAMAVQPARQTVRRTRGDDTNLDGTPISTATQRAEFNRRLAMSRQGSAESRRFLSEPPLDYRRPAETATVGDVGEDEWKKDRQRKGTKRTGLRDLWPF